MGILDAFLGSGSNSEETEKSTEISELNEVVDIQEIEDPYKTSTVEHEIAGVDIVRLMTYEANFKVHISTVPHVQRFADEATNRQFDIDVSHSRYRVNGKSIMGLMSLDLSSDLSVSIRGKDLQEIKEFIHAIEDNVVINH